MSKELEALKKMVKEINTYKFHGIGEENWLGIQDILKDVYILEKALTPLTADEVCNALSEWLKENDYTLWSYAVNCNDGGFYYYDNKDYEMYLVEYDKIEKKILFSYEYFPPHLITMIGRFYESLLELDYEKE